MSLPLIYLAKEKTLKYKSKLQRIILEFFKRDIFIVKYKNKTLREFHRKKYPCRKIKIFGENFIVFRKKPILVNAKYSYIEDGIPLMIKERFVSQIKSLVNWYNIFLGFAKDKQFLEELEYDLGFKINIKFGGMFQSFIIVGEYK
jgi:hypothetical protein